MKVEVFYCKNDMHVRTMRRFSILCNPTDSSEKKQLMCSTILLCLFTSKYDINGGRLNCSTVSSNKFKYINTQCWEFATGSPQKPQVRNCGANFFIADFRHANLVFATCALRAQFSFLRIVLNRKRQKCTGNQFRKYPFKLVSAQ